MSTESTVAKQKPHTYDAPSWAAGEQYGAELAALINEAAILAAMRVQDLHIKMAETTSFTDLRYPEAIVGERQYGC